MGGLALNITSCGNSQALFDSLNLDLSITFLQYFIYVSPAAFQIYPWFFPPHFPWPNGTNWPSSLVPNILWQDFSPVSFRQFAQFHRSFKSLSQAYMCEEQDVQWLQARPSMHWDVNVKRNTYILCPYSDVGAMLRIHGILEAFYDK